MKRIRPALECAAAAATLALLTACGSSGGGGFVAIATPTPNPGPGTLTLSVPALAIDSMGVQTFGATDAGYAGSFSVGSVPSASCTGIVAVSPTSAAGPSATFTVTPIAAGRCTLTVTEQNGYNTTLAVVVTITGGTLQ